MKLNTILLRAVLLLAGCNPLRKIQRNQKADSTIVDRSEIRKVVTDILKESGTLTQTLVEFYPPVVLPPEGNRDQQPGSDEAAALPATEQQANSSPPAIKRIVHTEIAAQAERTTTTDSTAHNDIRSNIRSELSDEVVEKPPSSVSAIRWIAIGLVALLLIIVALKIRWR